MPYQINFYSTFKNRMAADQCAEQTDQNKKGNVIKGRIQNKEDKTQKN